MPSTVWVPNKGAHDYSAAEVYGKLSFLTEGFVNRMSVGAIARSLAEKMQSSQPNDFLLITSLPILNLLAGTILAQKHGTLRILLFQDGRYVLREVDIAAMLEIGELKNDNPDRSTSPF